MMATLDHERDWRARAVIGVTLVITLALLASQAAHVPFWDGRIYADCVIDAAEQRLAIDSLRCAEHISHAYMLYAGAVQMLSPGSFPLILLANALLYLLACAAFHRIASLAFPDSEHAFDRALLTSAFAAHPALLASVVQPNIDVPMLPALLWATVFALRRRWLALVATGILLVATKESGVLVYVSLLFAFAVAMVLPGPSSSRSPIRAVLRLSPLAIPVLLFIAYIGYRATIPHSTVIWAAATTDTPILYQFLVPRIDPFFRNYLGLMLVLDRKSTRLNSSHGYISYAVFC